FASESRDTPASYANVSSSRDRLRSTGDEGPWSSLPSAPVHRSNRYRGATFRPYVIFSTFGNLARLVLPRPVSRDASSSVIIGIFPRLVGGRVVHQATGCRDGGCG